ncbi:MAG: cytidylate kinase-like family protein [Pelovirga sp.]
MVKDSVWTQQMETKLQAWHKLQQVVDESKPAPCFTVTREFGCQAYPFAEALQKRLNARTSGEPWVIVGRQVIDEVAELSGYSVEQIEKSENTPASMKAIFTMFLDHVSAEETEIFGHMRHVIRGFARRGNCILVGRGATHVTQDLSNCIHLRLVAPLEFRVDKISAKYQMSAAEAREHINRLQAQREKFVERFVNEKPDNPNLYHLVMNNARMDVNGLAALADDYMVRLYS